MKKGIYAVPGEATQVYCTERHAPKGAVLMQEISPGSSIAQADGTWTLDPHVERLEALLVADTILPRWAEDIWQVIGIDNAPEIVQSTYHKKKDLRLKKPKKPKK